MVTFDNQGRLGNFLFEAATAFAYAKDHGHDFTVPAHTLNPYWNPIYLQHLVRKKPIRPRVILEEEAHNYKPLTYLTHWGDFNILLRGYFQSEKYFLHRRIELLRAFDIPWKPRNDVGIHVRRGDYLFYPDKHPIVPPEYYIEALKIFKEMGYRDAYVFSDDIAWCKEFFPLLHSGFNFHFSEGKTEMEDLIGFSSCAHQINSSSTFSWWGSWLNQNPKKQIVTPRQWFVEGHGGLDTSDIIPETWKKI
jgi:hypothetical protein